MTGKSPQRRARFRIGRYVAVAAVLIGLLYWQFVFTADGPRRILSVNCSGGSVDLDLSVYSHRLDFEQGGSVGYELTYQTKAGATIPLYDDDFSQGDRHGSVSAPYVSWRFDDSNFSGPYPSYTYAPLPAIGPVRVFKAEAQVDSPDLHRPRPSKLDFMNMFVDPRRVTKAELAEAANCLATHEREFDHALVEMQGQIPSALSRFYGPLRLGGRFLRAASLH